MPENIWDGIALQEASPRPKPKRRKYTATVHPAPVTNTELLARSFDLILRIAARVNPELRDEGTDDLV